MLRAVCRFESNDIIGIYPQTIAAPQLGNPSGCWDWYGFINDAYDTNQGVQIRTVNSMVTALRSTIFSEPVQQQFKYYPRNFHDPEKRAATDADARAAAVRAAAALGAARRERSDFARGLAVELAAVKRALGAGEHAAAAALLNASHTRALAAASVDYGVRHVGVHEDL